MHPNAHLLLQNARPASLAMRINNLVPTPAERLAGRFMRAPDHDAGTAGAEGGAAGGGGDAAAAAPAAGDKGNEAAAGGPTAAEAAAAAEAGKSGDQVTGSEAGADGKAKEGEAAAAAGGTIAGDAGEKSGDAAAAAAEGKIEVLGAPEGRYEVKAPEGMTFDQEAFDAVEPTLRDLNLSPAAAQALTSAYAEKVVPLLVARGEKQAKEAFDANGVKLRADWESAARADPEIGGQNFDRTVDAVAQVWGKFGIKKGEGIRALLDESGLGNHPDMLRFLSRVGTSMGEKGFVTSDGRGADTRPVWDRVYGQPEAAPSR
jgi:hypothetical protein